LIGSDREATTRLAHSLLGQRIQSVRYLYPSNLDTPPISSAQQVHEIDHGVEIQTEDGNFATLIWHMESECAAIQWINGSAEDADLTHLIGSYDVSRSPLWCGLIGREISKAGIAWHISEPGCPATPWAFRFSFSNGSCFVIALAEIRAGKVVYIPDNIAVLFDRKRADQLYAARSESSSWGADI
jgi:hypothetical protein